MKNIMETLAAACIVPVVVIEDDTKAVDTANALLEGGIDVMEITFRTAAAEASIRNVRESCPGMTVGAGTVITLEQCKTAVEAGAQFIVSPGFRREVVEWCVNNGIVIVPGCVTPTEIMMAMEYGLNVLKFFPADIYGGLKGMKNLSAPFGGIKFVPTGGVNTENIAEYAAAPFVFAVGGSWVCPRNAIASGDFGKITELSREARQRFLSIRS